MIKRLYTQDYFRDVKGQEIFNFCLQKVLQRSFYDELVTKGMMTLKEREMHEQYLNDIIYYLSKRLDFKNTLLDYFDKTKKTEFTKGEILEKINDMPFFSEEDILEDENREKLHKINILNFFNKI